MRVPIRKTAQGTEYWDTDEKQSLLVPLGSNPEFEVTENPESMLTVAKKNNDDGEIINQTTGFDSMSVKQLREYAAENDIQIPAGVTKKDDIISLLFDAQ